VRILISTHHFGGGGGIQRHVASTIECLGARHEIDVYADVTEDAGYLVLPPRGTVLPEWRWWDKARRRAFGKRGPRYDAYLHYQHGLNVQHRYDVGVRMVIPCGDEVRSYEHMFDAVLLEAPDNAHYVTDTSKAILLPPPLNVPVDHSEPVADLPEEFFLTIFNPHHPRKGLADMREVAPQSPIPFVWCRNNRFAVDLEVNELEGIIELQDLDQAGLRFLYERCRAYVCFDHNQGFGWSLADALQYGVPTLSRGRGVMSIPGLDTTGCWFFETTEELVELLQRDDYVRVQRDLGDMAPDRFVERFEALVRDLEVAQPRR
jgi:glycosyltransferase involved in cell wall biosynthesis